MRFRRIRVKLYKRHTHVRTTPGLEETGVLMNSTLLQVTEFISEVAIGLVSQGTCCEWWATFTQLPSHPGVD